MISVAIFTYKRPDLLIKCLSSLSGNTCINDLIIFNDDEASELKESQLLSVLGTSEFGGIRIFNPSDFGFYDRAFRKHIYMNQTLELAKNEKILFSDDDGRFSVGAVDLHCHALDDYHFCAGAIIRDRIFGRISKSILQGTNYSFRKSLLRALGGYDVAFARSQGGGDVEFWYRIYQYVRANNLPVAFLPGAIQRVTAKSTRRKKDRVLDPREYFTQKHGIEQAGPMYKWFPDIRNKQLWMDYINA